MRRHSELLTTAECGRMFGVDPKTWGRWASRGLVPSFRTPGGQRRYRRAEVLELYRQQFDPGSAQPQPRLGTGG